MNVDVAEIASKQLTEERRYARLRAMYVPAAATTHELAVLFGLSITGVYEQFKSALIRRGGGSVQNLYDRSLIGELIGGPYPDETLLTTEQAGDYLHSLGRRFGRGSLYHSRTKNPRQAGPPYVKLGNQCFRYRPADLREFAKEGRRCSQ